VKNEDFNAVILDGYLEKESKRLFGILVEPSALKRDVIENIQDKLTAIRNIKQYFGTTLQNETPKSHLGNERIKPQMS